MHQHISPVDVIEPLEARRHLSASMGTNLVIANEGASGGTWTIGTGPLGPRLDEGGELTAGGINATLHNGTLTLVGTSQDDQIRIDSELYLDVYVNGDVFVVYQDSVSLIRITTFGGNDSINFDENRNPIPIAAQIYGGAGNDTISGGATRDRIHGDAGNDVIQGNGGKDLLYGDDGNDSISGGVGKDFIHGGTGDDSITGDRDNDTLFGGDGKDSVYGNQGDDVVIGGSNNDLLYGGDGNDVIKGFGGNDYIDGQGGSDTLDGGYGTDKIFGSDGSDEHTGAHDSQSELRDASSDDVSAGAIVR